MTDQDSGDESTRLETLWRGEFGARYLERNAEVHEARGPFWRHVVELCGAATVLEVGCNLGGNLKWIEDLLGGGPVTGIDINAAALRELRDRLPSVSVAATSARALPFRSGAFELVFTSGVLIHQPDASLLSVVDEMIRCSSRFVLCAEYFAPTTEEVAYRGETGALFKRDYGSIVAERHPLELLDHGFLDRDAGWDDVTYWLFRK